MNPASVTFSNNTVPYTINSTGGPGISGSTGITLAGTSTVTFVGAKVYTGTTQLNAGTLVISSKSSLGTAPSPQLTFNGGTLQFAPSSPNTDISSRTVTISSGGATIDLNGNSTTFTNAIGNSGSGALTVVDSGSSAATLTLAGANTFSGPINLNGGIVNFSTLANLGTGSAINFGGGTLRWDSSTDISARTVTIGAGGATFDINGNNVFLTNPIGNGGSGGLTLVNSARPRR